MVDLDRTFAALANPKRRAIVARLVRGEATLNELAEPFGISLLAISRHLRVLEDASLITKRRGGKPHKCRLEGETLAKAAEWIDFHLAYWDESFGRLEVRSKRTKKTEKPIS